VFVAIIPLVRVYLLSSEAVSLYSQSYREIREEGGGGEMREKMSHLTPPQLLPTAKEPQSTSKN
jgi:hypothetical protein